jgi:hypothetical protein
MVMVEQIIYGFAVGFVSPMLGYIITLPISFFKKLINTV